jgi:hypothetical protein
MDVRAYQSHDVIHHLVKNVLTTILGDRIDLGNLIEFRVIDLRSRAPDASLSRCIDDLSYGTDRKRKLFSKYIGNS